jgi:hypothetical protein
MFKRTLAAACFAALAFSCSFAAASPGVGSGPFLVGATEDAAQYSTDGGAQMFAQMAGYDFGAVRMSLFWDGNPWYTPEAGLTAAVNEATLNGIRPILSIAPRYPKNNLFSAANGPQNLASFVRQVAQTFPQVHDFIVGNEPNLQIFNGPSWHGTTPIGAWNYERALAAAYDALHSFNPNVDVIGVATSPRGNLPSATSNVGIPPVKFIKGIGDAYRASARSKPIADNVAFHPYPNPNHAEDSPAKGYQWPNAGAPNLDRLQQAWWDAFHGTNQPLFFADGLKKTRKTAAAGDFVKWVLDEAGWPLPGYTGTENWHTVSEATQATYYADLVTSYACDSSRVAGLLFFHWIDEADRAGGFQSGFRRIDGSLRPAASSVKTAYTKGCSGNRTTWAPTNGVEGASATFARGGGYAFSFKAQEDVRYEATAQSGGRTLASTSGLLQAYWTGGLKMPRHNGPVTYTVRLTSVMNPHRTTTFHKQLG